MNSNSAGIRYFLMRSCIVSNVLFLLCLTGFFCDSAPAQDKPEVKIGLIIPLTGALAKTGAAFRDAAQLALEDADKKRFNYKLIIEDDNLQPSKVVSAAHKLLKIDKVDAIISTWSYGGSVVAPLAEKARTPHFGIAWDPTVATGRYNFIHLAPPDEFLSKMLPIFRKLGWQGVSAIGITESGSEYAIDRLESLLAQDDQLSLVSKHIAQFDERDFRPFILQSKKYKADVFYVNLVSPMLDLFLKQLSELKVKTPVVAMTGFDTLADLSLAEGKWYVSDSYTPVNLAEKLKARFGHTELYGTGNYYDLVKMIVFIYENTSVAEEKPSTEAILNSIAHVEEYPSLFGKLNINQEGIISYPAQYLRIKNGKRIPIKAEDIVQ